VADEGEITNTVFCLVQGDPLPYPDFVREPSYNNGTITITNTWDCTNEIRVTSSEITYTTSFFGFTPRAPHDTSRVGVYTSQCRVSGISSDTNCPNLVIQYGTVTWRIMSTNCIITGIQFAGTNRWRLNEVGFAGEPAGGGAYEMYDGFTDKFTAAVEAICQQGCTVWTNAGSRVAEFTHDGPNDYVVVHKVGQGGITVALPASLPAAIGELAATIIGDQIKLYGVDGDTLSSIANKINIDRPSSPIAGHWKDGQPPCCN
jgi:hypothetical protein